MIYVQSNIKQFSSGLIQLKSGIVDGLEEGMRQAMMEFVTDCFEVPPTVPLRDGALMEAHEIHVDRVGNGVQGSLTVDHPAAASLHEGISRWGTPYKKWTTPGSGPHWISSKQIRFRHKYLQKIGEAIQQVFREVMVRGHYRRKPFSEITFWVRSHIRRIKDKR